MAIKTVTYAKAGVLNVIDQLLNKHLKATLSAACSGRRTPYPQKGQQTLGATGVNASEHCGKPLKAANNRVPGGVSGRKSRIWLVFDQNLARHDP
jgi:hypothetical protein